VYQEVLDHQQLEQMDQTVSRTANKHKISTSADVSDSEMYKLPQ